MRTSGSPRPPRWPVSVGSRAGAVKAARTLDARPRPGREPSRRHGRPVKLTGDVLGRVRVSFWVAAAGVVVLYVFFVALASISPTRVAGVTAFAAALALLFTLRNLRLASELAHRGGDPWLRRARNRQRERRGF
jgi:hypothetical protein